MMAPDVACELPNSSPVVITVASLSDNASGLGFGLESPYGQDRHAWIGTGGQVETNACATKPRGSTVFKTASVKAEAISSPTKLWCGFS